MPTGSPETDSYLTPYREALERIGSEFDVTLWANKRSQQRRFQVMAQMTHLEGKRVLDAGCSRGDFAAFLLEHGVRYAKYVGVDGLEKVVAYARGRGLEGAEFHAGDFVANPGLLRTGDPQVIAISGSLNTMSDAVVDRVLENAWAAAGEELIFNFLSDRCGRKAVPQGDPARRLDTMRLLDWAMKKTWAVQFRQDYFQHGHDATILMRKG